MFHKHFQFFNFHRRQSNYVIFSNTQPNSQLFWETFFAHVYMQKLKLSPVDLLLIQNV